VILDAGFLISVDRDEDQARSLITALERRRIALHTTEPVVAQVWRNGARQARLAGFLKSVEIHPLDDGRAVGLLLARAGTSDVVDAHLVVLAVGLRDAILTGDETDLNILADAVRSNRPVIHVWP
jgi:predicted nucleic acid-binding protein